MMHCEQAQELITARVDDELGAAERLALDEHLQACAACCRAYEQESLLKRQIQSLSRAVSAPAALRRSVARGGAAWQSSRRWIFFAWTEGLAWRPAMIGATLLLIVTSLIYTQWPVKNLSRAAMTTHERILSGKVALVRSENPALMRRELTQAVDGRFSPVVLDFSMIKLYPVAGFVQKIAGREVLVTVYQGAGPAITCFTFIGSEADAPQQAERFYDAAMGLNFYSFTQGNTTTVLHREGGVICVLVSKMSPAELLALLRENSVHA